MYPGTEQRQGTWVQYDDLILCVVPDHDEGVRLLFPVEPQEELQRIRGLVPQLPEVWYPLLDTLLARATSVN